jgi:hypothetical protein
VQTIPPALVRLAWAGLAAIALVGHGLCVPAIRTLASASGPTPPLIDANLAQALAGVLALRVADALGVAALVAAIAVAWERRTWGARPGARGMAAVAAAGCAVALTGADRFVALPHAIAAWSAVDRITLRPLDRLEAAQAGWAVHALLVVLVALCAAAGRWAAMDARDGRRIRGLTARVPDLATAPATVVMVGEGPAPDVSAAALG